MIGYSDLSYTVDKNSFTVNMFHSKCRKNCSNRTTSHAVWLDGITLWTSNVNVNNVDHGNLRYSASNDLAASVSWLMTVNELRE